MDEKTYFPIGSVIFFVLLTVFFGLIWFGMLWIMAARD